MNGTHVVADLLRCKNHRLMCDAVMLKEKCVQVIDSAGFTIVGDAWHPFPPMPGYEFGGVTGTLLLAESHLAIHTWPEMGKVTLDVYTCNLSRNNEDATRWVVDKLIEHFKPVLSSVKVINRG